ncbi:MAG: OmpA family protein [Bacteroidota bacterium]
MTARAFLILILFFAWCVFSVWYYNCKIKGLCLDASEQFIETTSGPNSENEDKEKGEPENDDEKALIAASFEPADLEESMTKYLDGLKQGTLSNPNGISFFIGSDSAFLDSVASFISLNFDDLDDKDTLIIQGHYLESENQDSLGSFLAEKRAIKAKDILSIVLKNPVLVNQDTKLIRPESFNPDSPSTFFLSYNKKTGKQINSRVESIGDLTMIYFPENSESPTLDAQINSYLDNIATDLLADKYKSINATGYTDHLGSPKNNYYMGLHRAQAVQNYLVDQGCNPNQIEIKSYGEYRPVAENDTEDGRAKNRRVEIKLNY